MQVSHCWLQFHRVDCIFTWLTEVSHGIVKLIRFTTNISLGVSQDEHEFHMMLLKSHFKLKFSQHISQDQILYLLPPFRSPSQPFFGGVLRDIQKTAGRETTSLLDPWTIDLFPFSMTHTGHTPSVTGIITFLICTLLRAVTKSSSCWVYAVSRWGTEQPWKEFFWSNFPYVSYKKAGDHSHSSRGKSLAPHPLWQQWCYSSTHCFLRVRGLVQMF